MKNTNLGYTFIELIITLSIVGILASVGIPSFKQMIQQNKQTSAVNHFLSGLYTVRSEAIKRGRQVAACPSSDGNTCNNAVDWNAGWIIFVDDDRDNVHDSNETLIHIEGAMETGYTLIGSTDINDRIRYRPNGISLENGTFTVCDPRGASEARSIIISATGRPRTATTNSSGGSLSC